MILKTSIKNKFYVANWVSFMEYKKKKDKISFLQGAYVKGITDMYTNKGMARSKKENMVGVEVASGFSSDTIAAL